MGCRYSEMVPFAVNPTSAGNIVLLVFHGCLATFIVVINLCVFLCLVLTTSFRKENRFIYMMSTCVSDFLTGAAWYYVGLFDVRDTFPGKNSTRFVANSFLGLSYLVILAAQVDRYHAVTSPIQYAQRMTLRKTILVIACLWLYTYINLAAQNLVSFDTAAQIVSYGTFAAHIITVIIMIGLNIRLYLIAKYQLERDPPTPEREAKRSSLYLIITVAASFILIWAPIFLRIFLCHFTLLQCQLISNDATDTFRVMIQFNAVLTPIWYIRGCKTLREALFLHLRKRCTRCHSEKNLTF